LGPVATAGYRYRTPAVAAVTAVYRAVTTGKKTLGGAGENDGARRRKEWRVGSGGEEGSGTRVSVLQKYVGLVYKRIRAMG
jgi:hypothetical protein